MHFAQESVQLRIEVDAARTSILRGASRANGNRSSYETLLHTDEESLLLEINMVPPQSQSLLLPRSAEGEQSEEVAELFAIFRNRLTSWLD